VASAKHADVNILGLSVSGNASAAKSKAEIGIDQIRQMQSSASLSPFEGERKVFIIDGAELMSIEAANSLLKTLEEPVGRSVFILLTTNEGLLPATVVSRCQRLELPPLSSAEVETALSSRWSIEPSKARLLARLSHGCLGWAVLAASDDDLLEQRAERLDRLMEIIDADYETRFAYAGQLAAQFGQNRRAVLEVLELWLDWWRDLLLVRVGCGEIMTNVDYKAVLAKYSGAYSLARVKSIIESAQAAGEHLRKNVNPRLALETLMLNMCGKEDGGDRRTATEFSL
jgi:DNA polymerase-3 subunit delta'